MFNVVAGAYSNTELVPRLGQDVQPDASIDVIDTLLSVLEDDSVQV